MLVFFVLLFTFTKILGPIPFDITQVTTSKTDAFTVTGEGKVEAVADSAKVSLGVLAKAATSELAQDRLNENINKVIESIKKLGVRDIDIKTENYNIYPNYGEITPVLIGTDQSVQNNITGYTANTNITVTVKSAEIANQVIDAGTSSGANQVGGVDFQVKDKNQALNKARELAVADARKKAEDAARIAGFKLGKVINYSESEDGDYPFAMMSKAEGSREGGIPTQVQPGTNEIAVTVSLSYEIR
ncbi:SIMPL domain-containing protein [Candidatus Daviesbacteria bacterium]|nr:SIMPL domain-containing protein [Candidatus Daviesbacteria bacterium]